MNTADITVHCLAFDGDLYGECVREYQIMKQKASRLNIRIDPIYLTPFLNVLSLKYKIFANHTNGAKYTRQYVIDGVEVNVLPFKRFDFRAMPCDFDCNLLALNNESIYVWKQYPVFKNVIDKVTWLTNRILNKRFCLVHKNYTETPPGDIIEKAKDMVVNGWIMDAVLLEKGSWLLNKWKSFPLEEKMKCSECAICQEEYSGEDIVIRTCCNHNFHWTCKNVGGLKNWVCQENQHSCPKCRSNMF